MDFGVGRAVDSQKQPVPNRYQPEGRPRPLRASPSTWNIAECTLGHWLYPSGGTDEAKFNGSHQ